MPERLIAKLFVVVLLSAISVAQTPVAANSSERTTSSSPSPVAADKTGWDSLRQLHLYQEARVVLTDGESFRGKLSSVNDDALVIQSGSGDQTFARDRIQRVAIRRPAHRGRNALIGAAIGAGTGLGLGAGMDHCPKDNFRFFCGTNTFKATLTPVFGLMGAGIGAFIPTGGWHEAYRLR